MEEFPHLVKSSTPSGSHIGPATTVNTMKVRESLKHMVRDWSEEGKKEREAIYEPILSQLAKIPIEERRNHKVLVPGSGLGRLAWEIANLGFDTTSCELSYYMNLCLRFLLSEKNTERTNQHTLHPYSHWWSHQRSNENTFRGISLPDVLPRRIPNWTLLEEDFLGLSPPLTHGVDQASMLLGDRYSFNDLLSVISTLLSTSSRWQMDKSWTITLLQFDYRAQPRRGLATRRSDRVVLLRPRGGSSSITVTRSLGQDTVKGDTVDESSGHGPLDIADEILPIATEILGRLCFRGGKKLLEEVLQPNHDRVEIEHRLPVLSEDVEANIAFEIHIWMVNLLKRVIKVKLRRSLGSGNSIDIVRGKSSSVMSATRGQYTAVTMCQCPLDKQDTIWTRSLAKSHEEGTRRLVHGTSENKMYARLLSTRLVSTTRPAVFRALSKGTRIGGAPKPLKYLSDCSTSSIVFTGDVPLEKFLSKQLIDARKTRDAFRTNLLRIFKTVIGELQTEQKIRSTNKGVTPEKLEEAALKSVRKMITKRRTAATEYRSSNLIDSAENEEREAAFLESLLPRQLTEEETAEAIRVALAQAKKDGTLSTETPTDVKTALRVLSEGIEKAKGKGAVESGTISTIALPLLQKEGVVSMGKKK
ncbi:11348_t:CDS:10 [Acaulospora colombiana]|uniref:11348_t:CDS:1 n=1 Tax=Acaulospora colombiana TaxID=27376 RepID=A0ACA9LPI3_9GLOM|nr:11348_t:CDS:10 [Acaulospora colombiana]